MLFSPAMCTWTSMRLATGGSLVRSGLQMICVAEEVVTVQKCSLLSPSITVTAPFLEFGAKPGGYPLLHSEINLYLKSPNLVIAK